jgi:hypothetical protein
MADEHDDTALTDPAAKTEPAEGGRDEVDDGLGDDADERPAPGGGQAPAVHPEG